jgi:hypothetical protein
MPQVQDNGPPRLEDYLFSFENGMDSGTNPALLPPNTLAFATNGTVRGDFFTNRPPFRNINLTFASPTVQTAFQTGLFQGACYARPDNPNVQEVLCVSISGKLYVITPDNAGNSAVVDATGANAQNATAPICWLWQAENFVIWNDGVSGPVFYDVNAGTTTRSNWLASPTQYSTTLQIASATGFFIAPIGQQNLGLQFVDQTNMVVGDILTFKGYGSFRIANISGGLVATVNVSGGPQGVIVPNGTTVTWQHGANQLPPGRMGAYIMGRNWMSLIDGRQFIASDQAGDASGTAPYNYRDACLYVTENAYLAGGGTFSVPSVTGQIRAIIGLPTLDASLGQGPVLVVTPKAAYSCQTPVDRTTWSTVTNPILTVAMLTNAGLGQNNTISANSDILMRSIEGIRSLRLTRNDFSGWGNTTISNELERLMPRDQQNLLIYGSGIVFNNRGLFTVGPVSVSNGVYHQGMIVLDFSPSSTIKQEQPPVWDGLWLNLNVLQLLTGTFNLGERAYVFALSVDLARIELHEIRYDYDSIYDDSATPISMSFESPVLFHDEDKRQHKFKELFNGEIFVDDLQGVVNFDAYYKPDQWPAWVPWFSWQECAQQPTGVFGTANYQPGYKPRMGLGQPSAEPSDNCNNRPLRQGYRFQVKLIITGHCRFMGARFESKVIPAPTFAPMSCDPICTPAPLATATPIFIPPPLAAVVTDWVARVVAAGGLTPAFATQNALNNFWTGIVADGLDSQIYVLNAFVADNLAAALTPLIKGTGFNSWVNHGFISGAQESDGVWGDGVATYMDTGFIPSAAGIGPNSQGIVAYVHDLNSTSTGIETGTYSSSANDDWSLATAYNSGLNVISDNIGSGTGRLTSTPYPWGFYSAQRTSASSHQIYFANSTHPFASIASNANAPQASPGGASMPVFAAKQGSTVTNFSNAQLSFIAFTKGLTSAQTQALYNRVQALRVSLGGGYR